MNRLTSPLLVVLFLSPANGFHVPNPFLAKELTVSLLKGPPDLNSIFDKTPLLDSSSAMLTTDGQARWVSVPMNMRNNNLWIADGGALDIAQKIALGITAMLFLLAGFTYLYASFVVHAVAEELENECKEFPELWQEYEDKLEKGETMAARPDLMQELGMLIQPLVKDKVVAMEQRGEGSKSARNASRNQPVKSEPERTIATLTSTDPWNGEPPATARG